MDFLERFDWIRTGLCFEPRGHDMMSGGFLYPPTRPENDIGILFIETSGCLPMCGHGTIGMVTFGLEHGLIQPQVPGHLKVEVPAGDIAIDYTRDGDKVTSVRIRNVPAFVAAAGRGDRRAGAGAADHRHRLWRQLLRDHRAAAGLSRARCAGRGAAGRAVAHHPRDPARDHRAGAPAR